VDKLGQKACSSGPARPPPGHQKPASGRRRPALPQAIYVIAIRVPYATGPSAQNKMAAAQIKDNAAEPVRVDTVDTVGAGNRRE